MGRLTKIRLDLYALKSRVEDMLTEEIRNKLQIIIDEVTEEERQDLLREERE